jgi:cell division protein FtsL
MALAKIPNVRDMCQSHSPKNRRRTTMEMTKTEKVIAFLLAVGALVCMAIDLGR